MAQPEPTALAPPAAHPDGRVCRMTGRGYPVAEVSQRLQRMVIARELIGTIPS